MNDRIVLLAVVVQQFFLTWWQRLVAYTKPHPIAFWQELVRRYESLASRFTERSEVRLPPPVIPDPMVRVGGVAINPKFQWIEVRNQPGIKNANGFHRFGDHASIPEGGRLTALAVDGNQVLVSFENPKGQGAGAVAGNGTLFFVSAEEFASMTLRYDQKLAERADEKVRVLTLLRRSLELELLNHRRTETM